MGGRNTPGGAGDPVPQEVTAAEATPGELADLVRMHLAATERFAQAPKGGPLVDEVGRGEAAAEVRSSFSSDLEDEQVTVIVGRLGEAVVGYATMSPDGTRGRIGELWVDPAARRVGVGTALLDVLRAEAAARAMTGVDSVALPGDRDTKNFFEDHAMVARAIIVGTTGS